MITFNSKLLAKVGDEIKHISFEDLRVGYTNINLFSYNYYVNKFEFTPIIFVKNDTSIVNKVVFENQIEKRYEVFMSPCTKVFTRNKGMVPCGKLSLANLVIDCEDRYCKMIENTSMELEEVEVLKIHTNNGMYCCNGIFVNE